MSSDGSSPDPAPTSAPSRGRRWRPGGWPLRVKLGVLLLVPLAIVGLLATQRVGAGLDEAAQLDAYAGRVDVGREAAVTADALQRERAVAAGFVGRGRVGDPGGLTERIAASDAQIDALRSAAAGERGAGIPEAVAVANGRLAGLTALRNSVRGGAYPDLDVVAAYNAVIATVLELSAVSRTAAVPGEDGGDLQRAAAAVDAVARAEEQVSRQQAVLLPVLVARAVPTPRRLELLRAADAQFDAAVLAVGSASPAAAARLADAVTGVAVDDRERIVQTALVVGETGAPVGIAAERWDTAAGDTVALLGAVEAELGDALRAGGAALAAGARLAAVRDALLVGTFVAVALILLVVVARSLLRPLRRLRAAALDVARRRLPEAVEQMRTADGVEPTLVAEPIGIDTREEIGEVARAFDAVHREAVRLAAQQALLRNNVNDIFVNLSQRSQVLVKRQLALIDDLERNEQDPDHLGNLFQLDHLATRMRRNNENLLVLAGAAELRARRKRPVPARDILRAAVSEIEQYRRVTVRRAPGLAVAGPVVNDLVHLVAELLDNATAFSPPDSEVMLRAATGSGGTLVIEIADSGVGMSPDELGAVNAQLADPPLVDVAVARRMGLFVVGRLAQRHNIAVTLRRAPVDTGLWATVEVPAVYLQSGSTPGAEPELDMPTAALPVVIPAARAPLQSVEEPAPLVDDEPAAPAPPTTSGTAPPRRAPRRDGPVPADDPLSGPWLPAPVEPDEHDAPIYGEMRSAWFRQRRFASALGTDWQAQGPPARPSEVAPRPASGAAPGGTDVNGAVTNGAGADGPGHGGAVPDDAAPSGAGAGAARRAPDLAPAAAPPDEVRSEAAPAAGDDVDHRRADAGDPEATPADQGDWGNVDAGFAAARSAADRRPDGTTAAGLPRRIPRSQLVPGSIAVGGGSAPARPAPRSPEMVRGRLSGYQRGLREGREARIAEIARRAADGQSG